MMTNAQAALIAATSLVDGASTEAIHDTEYTASKLLEWLNRQEKP